VDIDASKIALLKEGILPIHEPGLQSLVDKQLLARQLQFSTDAIFAVEHAEVIFIAVGTPLADDGSANISDVLKVAETIGKNLKSDKTVVIKSTVPVGTAEKVQQVVQAALEHRQAIPADISVAVISNPEFLKEGSAVHDFKMPDRIVIGLPANDAGQHSKSRMAELYVAFQDTPTLYMDVKSAELTKYAANAMLAARISFMNELAGFAQIVGADIEQVRQGIGTDIRIGPHFLNAGIGYGGSCFPKDVQALIHMGQQHGKHMTLLSSVHDVNVEQKYIFINHVLDYLGDNIENTRIALWGLAFKPGTDDMREAPSTTIIKELCEQGAIIQAYDPLAMPKAKKILQKQYGDSILSQVQFCTSAVDALSGADMLIIATEWPEFKRIDITDIKKQLNTPCVFDGRNLFDAAHMREHGFNYHAIGRSS
jgi:UDPglucose 6-dehydrogenase